ncbi:hypothetical protein FZI91_21060 [Mycobacterium sp. CBMA271]|nr:hypothetical protein [Mycobacteroides sp. CBMA 326]MUM24180.1 hypothetical protein [Mycobacteroides sp. CBMA 271]
MRLVVLASFLPVLLYRIWRMWRRPISPAAMAITGFGVLLWLWLLAYTDAVWAVLPVVVRSIVMSGTGAVLMITCVQIFVVSSSGYAPPAMIRRDRRIILAVAACVLVVVAVAASQSHIAATVGDPYTFTKVLYETSDRSLMVAFAVSDAYVAAVLIQFVWLGWRYADMTPVGLGLGFLAAAAAVELVAMVSGGVWNPLRWFGVEPDRDIELSIQTALGCVVSILVVTGFLCPPIMLYLQARKNVRRLRPLRDVLSARFPGLYPPVESGIRLSDLVFEWTTHIQDGLTMQAQSEQLPHKTKASAPAQKSDHVVAIVDWLDGRPAAGFSSEWLRPPSGMSDEAWVLAIADAYRSCQEDSDFPALSSGMPSALRR